MATIRGTIMGLVDTALKAILITGGYSTNLGAKIYEWRPIPLGDDVGPAATYKDTLTRKPISQNYFENTISLEVVVYGNTVNTVRDMVGDVIKAVGLNQTWGGNAKHSIFVSEDTGVAQKDKLIAVSHLTFSIQYHALNWST